MAAGQRANQWSAQPCAELSKNQAKSAKTWHYTKVNFAASHPTISACYTPHPLSDCRRSVKRALDLRGAEGDVSDAGFVGIRPEGR
jgi:hypothetical protein